MTKPQKKLCPTCQAPNSLARKTCAECMRPFKINKDLKKQQQKLKDTGWASSAKKNRNSSKTVKSAQLSVFKLNALGYSPLLFLGHRGRKGRMYADVIHHFGETDGVVREIMGKMGKLYEHLLKKLAPHAPSPVMENCAPPPVDSMPGGPEEEFVLHLFPVDPIDVPSEPPPSSSLSPQPPPSSSLSPQPPPQSHFSLLPPSSSLSPQPPPSSLSPLHPPSSLSPQPPPSSSLSPQPPPSSSLSPQPPPSSSLSPQPPPSSSLSPQPPPSSSLSPQPPPSSSLSPQPPPSSSLSPQLPPSSSLSPQPPPQSHFSSLLPPSSLSPQLPPSSSLSLQPPPSSSLSTQPPPSSLSPQLSPSSSLFPQLPPSSSLSPQPPPSSSLSLQPPPSSSLSSQPPMKKVKLTECRKHRAQKVFLYESLVDNSCKVLSTRVVNGKEEVKVRWTPCSRCGKKWDDTWEPAQQYSSK